MNILTDIDMHLMLEKGIRGGICNVPFLPERKKLGKVEKLVTSLEDKCEYVVHIKSLKKH